MPDKRSIFITAIILLFVPAALAHQPEIVSNEMTVIKDPGISRAFYGELAGRPQTFLIESTRDFDLYLNLLVPKSSNPKGRFSAKVFSLNNEHQTLIGRLDQNAVKWTEFYEPFAGDYYLKGPEFKKHVPAGTYMVFVFNKNDRGKYVLAVGEKEAWGVISTVKSLIILPKLKAQFFNTSVFKLFIVYMGFFYWIGSIIFLGLVLLAIRSIKR